MNRILFSFLIMLLSTSAFAQTAPQLMSYQGVARNAEGRTLTEQSISLRISIISGDNINRPVYTETHEVTTNNFGLFNLKVGSGEVVNGDMKTVKWGNADHFIAVEIDVQNNGNFIMTGTSQLLSVPYAFYAEKAGVSETTLDATAKAIDFPGTQGQTIRHNGTAWEATSSMFNTSAGNIGIGITTPSSALDVNGDINLATGKVLRIGGNQVFSTAGTKNMFLGDGTGTNLTTGAFNAAIGFKAGEQLSDGQFNTLIGFKAGQNMSSASSNTIIGKDAGKNNSGNQNVLIGREAGIVNEGGENTFIGDKVGLANTTGTSNTLIGKSANVGAGNLINATAIGAGAIVSQDSSLILGNAVKVGIGTSTPAYDLEVNGDVGIKSRLFDSSGDAGTSGQILSSTGAGTNWITASGSGGGASADSVWGLYGNALLPTNAFLGTTDGRDIPFRTNNTEVMRITNGGGLLINSTVVGAVNTSGAGRKLIWDAQKMAFRVGSVSGSQWDAVNRGAGSIAMGINPLASGDHAVAIGNENSAVGNYSLAMGSYSNAGAVQSIAIGRNASATGDYSIALGISDTTTAENSMAIGYDNHATGTGATAFGHNNYAAGVSSLIVGTGNSASDTLSMAVGQYAVASGKNSRAFGADVLASGNGSMAMGHHVKATADNAIIIGNGYVGANPRTVYTENNTANSFVVTMANHVNADPEIFAKHDDSGPLPYNSFVGIGTSTPQFNLDVNGTFKADYMNLSGGNTGMIITSDSNGNMTWGYPSLSGGLWAIGGNNTGSSYDPILGTNDDSDLVIETNNTEVARFYSGGALHLSGSQTEGYVPDSIETGTHLIYSPRRSAMRVGYGDSLQWLPSTYGQNSFTAGYKNTASGWNGIALGSNNAASGSSSFTIGANNSAYSQSGFAIGSSNSVFSGFAIGNNLNAGDVMAIGSAFTPNAPGLVQIGVTNPTLTVGNKKVGINEPNPTIPLEVYSPNSWTVAEFKSWLHSYVNILTEGGGTLRLNFGDTISHDVWSLNAVVNGSGYSDAVGFSITNTGASGGAREPMQLGPDGGATFRSEEPYPALGILSRHDQGSTTRLLYNEFRTYDTWFGTNGDDLVLSADVNGNRTDISITSYGNVGIGTIGPSEKLEVNGKALVTEQIIVGTSLNYDETARISPGYVAANKMWVDTIRPDINNTIELPRKIHMGPISPWAGLLSESKINFGDGDYVYVGEVGADDKLEMKGGKIYANTAKFGVNVSNPLTKLHISSGNWDVNTGNGDMMIGNGTYNLKFGVADGGGGAGIGRINMVGGLAQLKLGGGGADAMTITSTSVGIGISPSYRLHLSANSAAKPSSSAWTVASDARLKTNVHSFEDGLNLIEKINPVWFTYNGTAGMPTETAVGTIAQELEKVAPYMVSTWKHTDDKGTETEYLGVDYGAMDFVLINAIKELNERLKALEEENRQLRNK